jgi:hypothetical protein
MLTVLDFKHLFSDTYESQMLRDRAVAQIKTFCDKGADRKSRFRQTHFLFFLENTPLEISQI